METFGSYLADKIKKGEKVNTLELQEIMQNQSRALGCSNVKVTVLPQNDEIEQEVTSKMCRECGCTDLDCTQCIKKDGHPCWWVKEDLCSSCQ